MYFAQIDFFRRVLKVIVADQDFVDTQPGMWVQCDIDGISPKNYPGIGFTFDYDKNAFISPKPAFPSWILNSSTCQWEAPVQMPSDGKIYDWNESLQVWEVIGE